MKQNRKRMKRKSHSCALCKPHKTGGCDKRNHNQRRIDEDTKQQLSETEVKR